MCIFPDRNNYENEDTISSVIENYIALNLSTENVQDSTDYSKLEISADSLDIKLYNLIESHGDMPEDLLISNIENLVKRGANPNALLEVSYSVRKIGTYLPIIRHFYRDKYNEYTTVNSPMHAAVGNGSVAVVEKLIALGGKTDIVNQDKVYPIDIALKNDHVKMVDCLIAHGCKLSNANLSMSENTCLIERLVKAGANPKTININYALNNRAELKRLLALKPPLNDIQVDVEILMQDEELLDLLLENGMSVNINGKFPNECPIIFSAVKYGNMRAFKKLYEKGANIRETCRHGFGETPLQTAIYYQQIEIMEYLLNLKLSPNEKDWTGKSALILACNTDNDLIINMLLDRGAELEYVGYFGKSPLMYAVQYKHYIAAETLIKRKAKVNAKSKYGETPLTLAIANNDYAMIKLLVENGANPKFIYQSKNLAQYAEEQEASPAVVQYLKKLIQN
jgi:ankyrin repeat protein